MSDRFSLDDQEARVARLIAVMKHARRALENDQYGEAWLALNTAIKEQEA